MVSYFMVVGVTPQACVNSIGWFIKKNSDMVIDDVYFITSWGEDEAPSEKSRTIIESVVTGIKEVVEKIAPNALASLRLHSDRIIWIPEADLGRGTKIISETILGHTSPTEEIIVDTTAGRKMMTSSAVVSAMVLHHVFKRNVKVAYYWLRSYDRDTMKKKVYDLSENDADSVMFDLGLVFADLERIRDPR